MQLTQFELLQTKREQIDAQMRYILTLRDYWIVRAQLEHALAGHVPRERTAGSDSLMGAEDRVGPANPRDNP